MLNQRKSCLPSSILTFRSRVTKKQNGHQNVSFFSQNAATNIGIMSYINIVLYTHVHKLTSCHCKYDIKYEVTSTVIYKFEQYVTPH